MSVLRVVSGPAAGTAHPIQGDVVIGRENADVVIADTEISRRHAVVRPAGQGVVVEDLGSMNGTFVEGRRIGGPVTLTESATIRVGKSELALELVAARPTDEPIVDVQGDTRARDVPMVEVDEATRARDVPAATVDDATRPRDVPVADAPDATRARDVPVGEGADVTRARDVPVAEGADVTRARDVPVADPQATRARDAPVADLAQPTTARATSEGGASGKGLPGAGTVAGIPVVALAAGGALLLVVILVLLLG